MAFELIRIEQKQMIEFIFKKWLRIRALEPCTSAL